MRKFYVNRSEDVHGNSGTGVVAEGIIFDDGTGAFTWLTPLKTVTVFLKIADVKKLHSHNGRTVVIIEGSKRFEACQAEARALKAKARVEKRAKDKTKE
jgi:hypothetical protein